MLQIKNKYFMQFVDARSQLGCEDVPNVYKTTKMFITLDLICYSFPLKLNMFNSVQRKRIRNSFSLPICLKIATSALN